MTGDPRAVISGDEMRRMRIDAGLTTAELAKRLHVQPDVMEAMEDGRSRIRPRTALAARYVLDVQTHVDQVEQSLVHWINHAWAGWVPGDARDFRRKAGFAFDDLRERLGVGPLPPTPQDCVPDGLSFYARFEQQGVHERIKRIILDDPAMRRLHDTEIDGMVDSIGTIVVETCRRAQPPSKSLDADALAESHPLTRRGVELLATILSNSSCRELELDTRLNAGIHPDGAEMFRCHAKRNDRDEANAWLICETLNRLPAILEYLRGCDLPETEGEARVLEDHPS